MELAIIGATGLVGQEMIKALEDYNVMYDTLHLFASPKSVGKKLKCNSTIYSLKEITPGCFKKVDYILCSVGSELSKDIAKQAKREGAVIIDNSSAFRFDNDVPLVIPEVNLDDVSTNQIIANPNCSTIQAVVVLDILDKAYTVNSVEYTTYQAVSGSGTKGLLSLSTTNSTSYYPHDITETCIPQIDSFMDTGYTFEEYKMIEETKKILHRPDLSVSATCVRVPIPRGHAVLLRVELEKKTTVDDIKERLGNSTSILVKDDPSNNIYPVTMDVLDTDNIAVGRIRKHQTKDNVFFIYTVADNLRKGAAGNAVQILHALLERKG